MTQQNNIMLYQKYRPNTWSDVSGQEKTVKELKGRSATRTMPQSLILSGTTGTGKTTIARLIAKSITCENLSVEGEPCNECSECRDVNSGRFSISCREYNASNLDIEKVRDIETSLRNGSMVSQYQIIFIDEFQELFKSNQKASKNILKLLEDPIKDVYIIIGTMDISIFQEAVPGRCMVYNLKKLTPDLVFNYLTKIMKGEKIKPDPEKISALETLSKYCNGSLRDAISYLERCIKGNIWTEEEMVEELLLASPTRVTSATAMLLNNDVSLFLQTKFFNKAMVESMRDLLLLTLKNQYKVALSREEAESVKALSFIKPAPKLLEIVKRLSGILQTYYLDRTTIEVALFESMDLKAPRDAI